MVKKNLVNVVSEQPLSKYEDGQFFNRASSKGRCHAIYWGPLWTRHMNFVQKSFLQMFWPIFRKKKFSKQVHFVPKKSSPNKYILFQIFQFYNGLHNFWHLKQDFVIYLSFQLYNFSWLCCFGPKVQLILTNPRWTPFVLSALYNLD